MLSIESETFLPELEALIETTDVECKAAQGRDGRGEIPASIWETYSAMANTSGGDIYLGIEETVDHRFICRGIRDIQKVKKTFWDTLHGNKVNKNILNDNDVQTMEAGGMNILHIHVRKARRQDRPIYIGTNPMGNTYVRRASGDSPLDASNSPDLNLSSPDLDSDSPDLNVLLLETLKSWGYDKMPGKLAADRMETLIIMFCDGRWLKLSELASLLERDPKALQDQYLSKMLAGGKLRHKYPESKNHPMQAYRTHA